MNELWLPQLSSVLPALSILEWTLSSDEARVFQVLVYSSLLFFIKHSFNAFVLWGLSVKKNDIYRINGHFTCLDVVVKLDMAQFFCGLKPGYCLSALLQSQVETDDDNLLKNGQALETNISRFAS